MLRTDMTTDCLIDDPLLERLASKPSPLMTPYWAGAARGEVIAHCSARGAHTYPPTTTIHGARVTKETCAFLDSGKRISVVGELTLNTSGGQLSAGRPHGFNHFHEAVVQLRDKTSSGEWAAQGCDGSQWRWPSRRMRPAHVAIGLTSKPLIRNTNACIQQGKDNRDPVDY